MIKVITHFVLVSSTMLGTNNVCIIEHRLLFFHLKRQLSFHITNVYNTCTLNFFVPYMCFKILYNIIINMMMTHGKIPFSGFSNWKFLKRSSLGLTTHVMLTSFWCKGVFRISCHVNIILVKKVFSMFLILPQWHLHYPYMPLGPKENLSHHGKIVP